MGPKVACPVGALPRPARGLLFDLGNVLCDDTLWQRWLLQLLLRLGVQVPFPTFSRLWRHEHLDDVYRGRREFCEAFQAFLLSLGLSRAQIDEVGAACQARRRQAEASARPLPGVKPTLARLRAAGIALGILSNSQHRAPILRGQLDRFALGGMFSAILSSVDLGRTKPELLCYLAATQAMRLPADEVAFVGHDAAELAGAARAGLMTVAFNFEPNAAADVFIARFDDLLRVVGTRPAQAAA